MIISMIIFYFLLILLYVFYIINYIYARGKLKIFKNFNSSYIFLGILHKIFLKTPENTILFCRTIPVHL